MLDENTVVVEKRSTKLDVCVCLFVKREVDDFSRNTPSHQICQPPYSVARDEFHSLAKSTRLLHCVLAPLTFRFTRDAQSAKPHCCLQLIAMSLRRIQSV